MPNCKLCGEEITDKQESDFGKKCPSCVRNSKGKIITAIFYASLYIVGVLSFIGGIIIRAICELYPYDSTTMIEFTSWFLTITGAIIALVGFFLELVFFLDKTNQINK